MLTKITWNDDWKFTKDSIHISPGVSAVVQGNWEEVTIPHTWNGIDGQDGGYSTWRANITPYLKDQNEIVVAVDNAPNDRVYPQVADFTFYGGIYRNVSVLCVGKTRILDERKVRFGCRSFNIDPEKGFILNGESYPLRNLASLYLI